MITRIPKALLSALVVVSFSVSASAVTQKPQPRITSAIDSSARAPLAGSQPPRVRRATDLGAIDASTRFPSMTLVFTRSAAQQTALDNLIAAQQNPASPQFHQWLTPAQFGARFGMADVDIAKVEAWLQSQGFSVDAVSPSRDRITFSGTASSVAQAFGAPIHRYQLGAKTHIAPSADLTLPAALSGVVAGITGVSDFRPHAQVIRHNGAVRPSLTSSQTGNFFLTPLDIATIYDIKPAYSSGYNGSGQSIAVVGQSAVVTTDVTNFQTALGQAAKAPTIVLMPGSGASTVYSEDESESDLDLEYTSTIAPGATIYFVYTGDSSTLGAFDALVYAVQQDIAPIINISYGECEPDLGQSGYAEYEPSLQQAAAQGQTIVSAAGDSGSADCDGDGGSGASQTALAVDFPSSSQYVTGVGGTEFPIADVTAGDNIYFQAASGSDVLSSALSYIPEQVWNDDTLAGELSSGGGGVSIFTSLPSWQTGVPGIPSGSFRFVPDIALDASPNDAPYLYCSSDITAWASGQLASCTSGLRDSSSQDFTIAGGTSFAAPIFAGMVAILNQARGYTAQGVVNPELYTLASNSTLYASAFHDITSGSNACNLGIFNCGGVNSTQFAAAVGYDEASGLGSVDFYNLLTAWPNAGNTTATAPRFTLAATAATVTAGNSTTSTVTVTPANGYTGAIAWSVAPATIPDTCYSISNATVSGSTPVTATLNIAAGTSSTCASGFSPLFQAGSQSGGHSGTSAAALDRPSSPAHRSIPAAPVTLAALDLASLGLLGLRRNRRIPTLLAVVLLTGLGLSLSGCGGGNTTATCGVVCSGGGGGTTPTTNTYTVTLVGTDTANSAITAQTTFNITLTTTAN
ncbi:MAG TPA: S53 family peptidase [Acidobacteriaceae bacterium]|jgi:subtilase family serine protease|nr:S53 family peptidase [Acidobacteriaceae bacterium]